MSDIFLEKCAVTSLKTEFPLQLVQDFTLHWEINDHAGLRLNGILQNGSEDMVQRRDYIGTEIAVILADTIERSGDNTLFLRGGEGIGTDSAPRCGDGLFNSRVRFCAAG